MSRVTQTGACPYCPGGGNVTEKEELRTYRVRSTGEEREILSKFFTCRTCGVEFVTPSQYSENFYRLYPERTP